MKKDFLMYLIGRKLIKNIPKGEGFFHRLLLVANILTALWFAMIGGAGGASLFPGNIFLAVLIALAVPLVAVLVLNLVVAFFVWLITGKL